MRLRSTTRSESFVSLDRALLPLPYAIAPRRIAVVFSASVGWHARVNIETPPRTLLSANHQDNWFSAPMRVTDPSGLRRRHRKQLDEKPKQMARAANSQSPSNT
jgi:hypothetical protein